MYPAATVAYTASGVSALRASRERPTTPILALTPDLSTARRLALAWGIHPIPFDIALAHVTDLIDHATSVAVGTGMAHTGPPVLVIPGPPFRPRGRPKLLTIATLRAGQKQAQMRGGTKGGSKRKDRW